MIGLLSCEARWPRANGCTAQGTSVFVRSEHITVASPVSAQYQGSEKYVYSALNGVKLCKPRPALDRLSISTVYISKKQNSLRVARESNAMNHVEI